jgi:peptide/nickel transport system ATP-binding protein
MSAVLDGPSPLALEIDHLGLAYLRSGEPRQVLDDVTFCISRGEAYGLVGESGCGKSTVAFTIMRHLPRNARILGGTIRVDGVDILALSDSALREFRGKKVAMVYQEPGSALNPSMRIGDQVAEVFLFRHEMSRRDAQDRARDMLERVALSDAGRLMRRYPHQLSGGQQQRVVIATALAMNPSLLVLDEPTTGLDATVEAEVMDFVEELRDSVDAAILFITHNLGLVARVCDRLSVLYAGRVVEEGPAKEVFAQPTHPYTLSLLRCVPSVLNNKSTQPLVPIPGSLPETGDRAPGCYFAPRCGLVQDICLEAEPALKQVAPGRMSRCLRWAETHELPALTTTTSEAAVEAQRPLIEVKDPVERRHDVADELPAFPIPTSKDGEAAVEARRPLIEVKDLVKRYHDVVACHNVSFTLYSGEVLGIVGESGSGKTTLAKCIAGLAGYDEGSISLLGRTLSPKVKRRPIADVRAIQMIFQSPDSTLNPSHDVRYVLRRAIAKLKGTQSVEQLARSVSLSSRQLRLKTTQLSGGQKQRVAIGRAFAGSPAVVLCDEPVSALDVSVQAAVLGLLKRFQAQGDVAYLFISHDLGVVRYIADRVAVMYLAEICELGDAADVFQPPYHPYTEALFSSIPDVHRELQPERIRLEGTIPSLANPPEGCRFHARCPRAIDVCATEPPPWRDAGNGHAIRCHLDLGDLLELQRAARRSPESSSIAEPHLALD